MLRADLQRLCKAHCKAPLVTQRSCHSLSPEDKTQNVWDLTRCCLCSHCPESPRGQRQYLFCSPLGLSIHPYPGANSMVEFSIQVTFALGQLVKGECLLGVGIFSHPSMVLLTRWTRFHLQMKVSYWINARAPLPEDSYLSTWAKYHRHSSWQERK